MCSNKYFKNTISAMLMEVKSTTYSIGYRMAKKKGVAELEMGWIGSCEL